MFGASIKPKSAKSCQSIVEHITGLGALTDTLQQTLGLPPTILPSLSHLGGGGGLLAGSSKEITGKKNGERLRQDNQFTLLNFGF